MTGTPPNTRVGDPHVQKSNDHTGRAGSFTPGSAAKAADGSFSTYTVLGDTLGDYPNGRMSITLAFANVPAVPEPASWALLLAGADVVLRLGARRRA